MTCVKRSGDKPVPTAKSSPSAVRARTFLSLTPVTAAGQLSGGERCRALRGAESDILRLSCLCLGRSPASGARHSNSDYNKVILIRTASGHYSASFSQRSDRCRCSGGQSSTSAETRSPLLSTLHGRRISVLTGDYLHRLLHCTPSPGIAPRIWRQFSGDGLFVSRAVMHAPGFDGSSSLSLLVILVK